jgi:hypothetical protein
MIPLIEFIKRTTTNGRKEIEITRIEGFPTTEEILKRFPDYMNTSHLCMDDTPSGNILCIRNFLTTLDLRVGTTLPISDDKELEILMQLIDYLLSAWKILLNTEHIDEPVKCDRVTFSSEGYFTTPLR